MITKFLETVLTPYFLFSLCSICFCISAAFSVLRQIQMLQQNSYFPGRYTKWLRENDLKHFDFKLLIFFIFYLNNNFLLLAFSIFSIVFMFYSIFKAIKLQKKSVIKLVFTARVKRMYAFYILMLSVISALQIFLVKDKSYWLISFSLLLSLCPYISVYILWAAMYPAERFITRRYIKDAEKILDSYAGNLTVVGITGSYGKTGTKQILLKMLSEKFNTVATPKNFNTPMGVVRTVRECLRPETEVFICEMGAKNKGDINELCMLAKPDKAIITSVGPQHLDTFLNIETVINTKFELYDFVHSNGGSVFANTDNKYIKERSASCDITGYGTDSENRFYADEIEINELSESFNLHLKDEVVRVHTKLLGRHNILNIVGAAALSYSMGVSAKQIAFAVSRLEPAEHRLELKKYIGGSTLIDDAYNANPEGCIEACNVLSRFKGKNRILVTPGLVELGEKEKECNYNLGKTAAECADIIILVGIERSKPIADGINEKGFDKENLFVVPSFAKAKEIFAPLCNKNTVLLFENDLPDNYLK